MNLLDDEIKRIEIMAIDDREVRTVRFTEEHKINDYLRILSETTSNKNDVEKDSTNVAYQSYEVLLRSNKRGTAYICLVDNGRKLY